MHSNGVFLLGRFRIGGSQNIFGSCYWYVSVGVCVFIHVEQACSTGTPGHWLDTYLPMFGGFARAFRGIDMM